MRGQKEKNNNMSNGGCGRACRPKGRCSIPLNYKVNEEGGVQSLNYPSLAQNGCTGRLPWTIDYPRRLPPRLAPRPLTWDERYICAIEDALEARQEAEDKEEFDREQQKRCCECCNECLYEKRTAPLLPCCIFKADADRCKKRPFDEYRIRIDKENQELHDLEAVERRQMMTEDANLKFRPRFYTAPYSRACCASFAPPSAPPRWDHVERARRMRTVRPSRSSCMFRGEGEPYEFSKSLRCNGNQVFTFCQAF